MYIHICVYISIYVERYIYIHMCASCGCQLYEPWSIGMAPGALQSASFSRNSQEEKAHFLEVCRFGLQDG